MSKSIGAYLNANKVISELNTKAQQARDELARQGIVYPEWYAGKDVVEHYDAVREYGIKETEMIMKLNAPKPEPRPVIEVKSEMKTKQWARPYYED